MLLSQLWAEVQLLPEAVEWHLVRWFLAVLPLELVC